MLSFLAQFLFDFLDNSARRFADCLFCLIPNWLFYPNIEIKLKLPKFQLISMPDQTKNKQANL